MSIQVVNLKCPGCQAPVDTSEKNCKYCGRPIVVTTFNSFSNMTPLDTMKYKNTYQEVLKENPEDETINSSMGMCLLKLGMYEKALERFEKSIEGNIENSETFFWAGVSMLNGKRPFLNTKSTIDKAIEYATTASMIESRGIYNYFIAYLKFDYYLQKGFNIQPSYREDLEMATVNNLALEDINILQEVMKVEFPTELLTN